MSPHATPPDDCHGCREYRQLSRRAFLGVSGMTVFAAAAPSWLPRIAVARDYRGSFRDVIVCVYLRGAADGLTLCVPYGDPQYYTVRNLTAVAPPTGPDPLTRCTDLNGFMGLPPAMAPLLPYYQDGTLAIVHATGSPDPSRSHFDAQRYMEVGKPADPFLFTGWLGRHIQTVLPLEPSGAVRGVGIGTNLQLALKGGPKTVPVPNLASYGMTGPTGTRTARLNSIVGVYNQVAEPVRSSALNTQATIALLQQISFSTYVPAPGSNYSTSSFNTAMKSAAALIRAQVGVEAVAVDIGGWDTHASQGVHSGTMYNVMNDLARGLAAFRNDVFNGSGGTSNVTVVVMSEFGRRVAENASGGTDHGHGGVMLVMGGHVNGGQVLNGAPGQGWPGLANLYQNLDLHVQTDWRDILAEIVAERLNNPGALATIFPDYTPTFRGICNG
jgi:uncharacterized protein (DUF1501 family)